MSNIHYGNSTAAQKTYIQKRIQSEIYCNINDCMVGIEHQLWEDSSCSLMEIMDNLYCEQCQSCGAENESACACACYEHSIQEPLEYYFVSPMLGEQLSKINEPVLLNEFCDKAIWGRTCSGQSIELDPTFWEIFQGAIQEGK